MTPPTQDEAHFLENDQCVKAVSDALFDWACITKRSTADVMAGTVLGIVGHELAAARETICGLMENSRSQHETALTLIKRLRAAETALEKIAEDVILKDAFLSEANREQTSDELGARIITARKALKIVQGKS